MVTCYKNYKYGVKSKIISCNFFILCVKEKIMFEVIRKQESLPAACLSEGFLLSYTPPLPSSRPLPTPTISLPCYFYPLPTPYHLNNPSFSHPHSYPVAAHPSSYPLPIQYNIWSKKLCSSRNHHGQLVYPSDRHKSKEKKKE